MRGKYLQILSLGLLCLGTGFGCTKHQISPIDNQTTSGIRFYGHHYGDFLTNLESTPEGDLMFGGGTYSFFGKGGKAFIQKTDPKGNVLWYKTYGGSSVDNFNAVHVTSDGGFIGAGATNSFGYGVTRNDLFFDAYLVKTDKDGNVLWQKTFGSIYNDLFFDVAETPDHGYIGVGRYATTTFNCIFAIKTDQNGNMMWTRYYYDDPSSFWSNGSAVTIGKNGNIGIAGSVVKSDTSFDTNTFYPTFILLSSNGTSLNYLPANGRYPEYTNCVLIPTVNYPYNFERIISRDDGYIMASNLSRPGKNSIMIYKVDARGNVIWSHPYSGLSGAQLNNISNNENGGILISGGTTNPGGLNYIWLLNTDANGNKIWENSIPVKGFSAFAAGTVSSGNSYAVGVNMISSDEDHAAMFGFLNIDQNGKIIESNK